MTKRNSARMPMVTYTGKPKRIKEKEMKVKGYEIKPGADLRGANLSGADLNGVNLRYANLHDANLRDANLSDANLRCADLRGADLRGADLCDANLSGANLRYANLHDANLRDANLSDANLRCADLRGADLRGADLCDANLSGAKGLLLSKDWLNTNFKKNRKGYIVYKSEGITYYKSPAHWKNSRFITEIVNPNRTDECGCGVNFGTLKWVRDSFPNNKIRRMYLHWEDLADVVVPYNTDGKARCARLEKGKLL